MSLDVLHRQAVACYDNSAVYVLIYHSSLCGPEPLVIVIVSVPSVFTYVMIPHYRLGTWAGLDSTVKYKQLSKALEIQSEAKMLAFIFLLI